MAEIFSSSIKTLTLDSSEIEDLALDESKEVSVASKESDNVFLTEVTKNTLLDVKDESLASKNSYTYIPEEVVEDHKIEVTNLQPTEIETSATLTLQVFESAFKKITLADTDNSFISTSPTCNKFRKEQFFSIAKLFTEIKTDRERALALSNLGLDKKLAQVLENYYSKSLIDELAEAIYDYINSKIIDNLQTYLLENFMSITKEKEINDKIATNASNITTNASNIQENKNLINKNSNDIASTKSAIELNKLSILINTVNIQNNKNEINTNTQNITNLNNLLLQTTLNLNNLLLLTNTNLLTTSLNLDTKFSNLTSLLDTKIDNKTLDIPAIQNDLNKLTENFNNFEASETIHFDNYLLVREYWKTNKDYFLLGKIISISNDAYLIYYLPAETLELLSDLSIYLKKVLVGNLDFESNTPYFTIDDNGDLYMTVVNLDYPCSFVLDDGVLYATV